MTSGDVPEIRLDRTVRFVLSALCDAGGDRLPVGKIARIARLSPATVRLALADLEKGGLVRHALAPGYDRQPPRTVYWPTHDGFAVGAAVRRPGD